MFEDSKKQRKKKFDITKVSDRFHFSYVVAIGVN